MGQRESLNRYLKSVGDIPFEWGKHDCLTFTNNAYRAMYNEGWADDWLGRYGKGSKALRRKELESEFGFRIKQLPEKISSRLKPINHVPPLGALVTTKKSNTWIIGVAMGICTGTKAVFLSKEGVLYLPLDYIHQAWVKEI
jgi:hypothetical protein